MANFIEQKCNEAQKGMRNDALGRSGLSGKVKEFVDDGKRGSGGTIGRPF